MPSLGEILKEERIKRGINIKDLERITRVRSKYLLAIEKSEFSVLPGTTYTRAFIRTYANALGIDPAPLIEEFTKVYQRTSKDPEYTSRISTKTISPNRRMGYSTTRPIRKRSNAPSVIAVAAVLIIFAFVYIGLRALWAPQNKTNVNNEKV
jgi:cytoskeletal protein RodZ